MTLNTFQWATNANYSAGPDVGTPTKVDPASTANGFVAQTIAAPQHVNYLYNLIAAELLKAVDGAGGGTYVLEAPLEFQGADVRIAGDLEILSGGELNLQSGGFVRVLSGSIVDVQSGGDINVASGGDVNLASGGDINLAGGARINIASTGELNLASGSAMTADRGQDLRIDGEATTLELCLTPVARGLVAGTDTFIWAFSGSPPRWGWVQDLTPTPNQAIWFAVPGREGDVLTQIQVSWDGGFTGGSHAGVPTIPPLVELVVLDSTGEETVVASASDPSASAAAYDVQHIITVTGFAYQFATSVDRAYVRVWGEDGTNDEPGFSALIRVAATITRNSVVGTGTRELRS